MSNVHPIRRTQLPSLRDCDGDKDELALRVSKAAYDDVGKLIEAFDEHRSEWREHLEKSAKEEAEREAARKRRARILTGAWVFVSAMIVAGFGSWLQWRLGKTKDETVQQLTETKRQIVVAAQPSTGDTYLAGYRDGATIEGAKIRDTLLAQIPIVPQRTIAAKPPVR